MKNFIAILLFAVSFVACTPTKPAETIDTVSAVVIDTVVVVDTAAKAPLDIKK